MTSRQGAHTLTAVSLLLVVVFATGCDNGPELVNVTGTVHMDGKPLPNASIEFQPKGGSPSFATTEADGTYVLMFTRDRKGAMPGQHTVRITTKGVVTDAEGNEQRVRELLPAKYHEESELVREVVSGENVLDFDLESKAARKGSRVARSK